MTKSVKPPRTIVNQLLDVADATVKAASMDCGASLVLKPGSLGFVAGGFVADGEKLADAVKKLAGLAAKKDPNFPGINFDAETYEGVTFHTAKIPLQKGKRAGSHDSGRSDGIGHRHGQDQRLRGVWQGPQPPAEERPGRFGRRTAASSCRRRSCVSP